MTLHDPQNPTARRAYVICPRPELAHRLAALGRADVLEFLGAPTVVMTEAVLFECKLEGYRSVILRKCKEAFVSAQIEFLGTDLCHVLFGDSAEPADAFDRWWSAEEAETIEIPATW